jgi:hypothetical protein
MVAQPINQRLALICQGGITMISSSRSHDKRALANPHQILADKYFPGKSATFALFS